jgi:hypothetical protein
LELLSGEAAANINFGSLHYRKYGSQTNGKFLNAQLASAFSQWYLCIYAGNFITQEGFGYLSQVAMPKIKTLCIHGNSLITN